MSGLKMTSKEFHRVSKRDFENGAVRNEISNALKDREKLLAQNATLMAELDTAQKEAAAGRKLYNDAQRACKKHALRGDALKAEIAGLKEATKSIDTVCRDGAKEMIERDAVKSAWIYWDGLMRESLLTEELEAELDKHRWIPVGERLPDRKTMCHVFMPTVNNFTTYKGHYIPVSKIWVTNLRSHDRTRQVTHWKPIILPELNT